MNQYVSSALCVVMSLMSMALAAKAVESATVPLAPGRAGAFTIPSLPYAQEALEPYMSKPDDGFPLA